MPVSPAKRSLKEDEIVAIHCFFQNGEHQHLRVLLEVLFLDVRTGMILVDALKHKILPYVGTYDTISLGAENAVRRLRRLWRVKPNGKSLKDAPFWDSVPLGGPGHDATTENEAKSQASVQLLPEQQNVSPGLDVTNKQVEASSPMRPTKKRKLSAIEGQSPPKPRPSRSSLPAVASSPSKLASPAKARNISSSSKLKEKKVPLVLPLTVKKESQENIAVGDVVIHSPSQIHPPSVLPAASSEDQPSRPQNPVAAILSDKKHDCLDMVKQSARKSTVVKKNTIAKLPTPAASSPMAERKASLRPRPSRAVKPNRDKLV